MKTLICEILFLSIMLGQCEETPQMEIEEVRFGTSFGMCLGFCEQTMVFKPGMVEKKLIPRRNEELAEKSCFEEYAGFESLISKIDLVQFNALDETIGCPDCADGGAEWIEIITSGGAKKVTYEYGNEPAEVGSFISELRNYYDRLGECN